MRALGRRLPAPHQRLLPRCPPPPSARAAACSGPRRSAEAPAASAPTAAYGAEFLRQASDWEKRYERVASTGSAPEAEGPSARAAAAAPAEEDDARREELVRAQLRKLFKELWGHVSCSVAWAMHRKRTLEPQVQRPYGNLTDAEVREAKAEAARAKHSKAEVLQSARKQKFDSDYKEFHKIYLDERAKFRAMKKSEILRRRRAKPMHRFDNVGYSEEDPEYEAEEGSVFDDAWRQKSIVEDCWKAEFNQMLHGMAREMTPRGEIVAARTNRLDVASGTCTDRLLDVAAGAYRAHVTEQNRPVLTHELADFANPFMMKQSALERLLSERCLRNQLDERCMPRLLERHPDLVKLRARAPLPPEVLEPLAAFRGDVRWSFDARERLSQKLEGAGRALDAVLDGAAAEGEGSGAGGLLSALPENEACRPDQVDGVHHPWKNHVGFESAVPRGMAGGTKFGQPTPTLQAQIQRLRYPTLQRVAHTLPADTKWRAHVVRTIQVLERSKGWDYSSKLTAVNKMKEVYDQFKPSDEINSAFDKKLVLNRVPSHLKRKFARDKQYVKTFSKNFLKLKSWLRYRPSLTAREPLKISEAKLKSTQLRK